MGAPDAGDSLTQTFHQVELRNPTQALVHLTGVDSERPTQSVIVCLPAKHPAREAQQGDRYRDQPCPGAQKSGAQAHQLWSRHDLIVGCQDRALRGPWMGETGDQQVTQVPDAEQAAAVVYGAKRQRDTSFYARNEAPEVSGRGGSKYQRRTNHGQ